MRVDTSFNNFARGKIDHDMMGRYDLPVYQSGCDLVENFITNFKGNAIYRAGFETMVDFQDCVMAEFKFNNQQQYILVFYLNKIRFLSYDSSGDFGWVLNAGTPLEVATPYTLAQSADLDYTQNNDVMVVTHKDFEPYKLTRTAADAFTFVVFARKLDPFPLTWAATKAITGITNANPAVVTSVAHGYSTGDRVLFAGVTGMTQINTWTARVTVINANSFSIDINTTDTALFTAYVANGTSAKVLTGDYPRCCLFYKGRLYYGSSRLRITTLFGSNSGIYDDFTLLPVTASTAMIFAISEIAQAFEWLFAGDNSLIIGASDGIVAVNGGAVNTAITAGTIAATLTSAPPCNSAYPIKKDGLIFYVGLDGRNMYYFSYDLLQEAFQAEDANFLSYDITQGGIAKIRYKKDRNDLIFATTGSDDANLLSCNFKSKENIIGWHDHLMDGGEFHDHAVITDNNGKPQLFALTKWGSTYYIERQGELVEFRLRVKFFSAPKETPVDQMAVYKDADDVAYNRYIAEQMKSCIFLDNALIYDNLQSNLITYNAGAGTITATSNVFAAGDVDKHIVYKTLTGYESGRFLITGYTSAKIVTVTVLQEPTSLTYTDWYLSFHQITSGISQYNSTNISVVADGGYLDDFAVAAGAVDFEEQVTHVVMGYRYKGIIKSFSLGFQIQGVNTQTTFKAVSEFGVRCVASAGLEVGTSLYKLEPVQELSQDDINYLPPIPLDGTKYVQFTDDSAKDKFFYLVQDQPLPAVITSIILNANYAVTK